MSDFTQMLVALGAAGVVLSAGVVHGNVTIQVRRKPEPRKPAAEPVLPRPRSLRKDSQP